MQWVTVNVVPPEKMGVLLQEPALWLTRPAGYDAQAELSGERGPLQ